MSEDYTYPTTPTLADLRTRVAELERENAELRAKVEAVQVYARGIYGEVPPISFEDWYTIVRGEVQP